ncbi:MAG: LITAF-like zinc ribbon domain-containing protein [Pyrinomonadaceae bacterium]
MQQCQYCGNNNIAGSNFCRFCGRKFSNLSSQPPQFQRKAAPEPRNLPKKAPRPYSWKTDEFPSNKSSGSARETSQIDAADNPYQQKFTSEINDHPTAYMMQRENSYPAKFGAPVCPRCRSKSLPVVTRKISSAGWIVFVILLIVFFPFFWVGFLIKEDKLVCPVCKFEYPTSAYR